MILSLIHGIIHGELFQKQATHRITKAFCRNTYYMYLYFALIKKNIIILIPFFCASHGIWAMDTSNASEKKSKKGLFRKSVGHQYFNKIEIPSTSTKKKLRKSQGQIFNKEEITNQISEKKETTPTIYNNPLYKSVTILYQIPTKLNHVSKSEFNNYKKLFKNESLIKRQTYSNQGRKIVCSWELDPYADLYKELLY